MRPKRWQRPAVRPLLLIGALLVAGCAGAASSGSPSAPASAAPSKTGTPTQNVAPTASPTPATTPRPTPTASPVSPEAAFRQLVASDDWALIADLGGMPASQLITSIEGGDVYINPVHGVIQLAGDDAHLLVVAPDATGTRVFEETRINGQRSTRGPDGAWQGQAAQPASTDLLGALLRVPPVHADGTENVEGQLLTVLAVDEPVIVGSIGGVRAAEPDATADLRFLVDDTGYPVRIRFALASPREGWPAIETLELVVAPRPEPFSINPAADWKPYESTRGYSILMPATCEQVEGDENWERFDCGQRYLRIWTNVWNDSATTWTKDSVATYSELLGVEPALENTLRVGTKARGTAGMITTYRYAQEGTDLTMSDGVFVQGGRGYDVIVQGLRENEASDRAFFLQVLATMRFGG